MATLSLVDSSQPDAVRVAIAAALEGGAPVLPASAEHWASAVALSTTLGSVTDDVALVIRTSGSMGAPKAVGLTAAALTSAAAATSAALGGHGQWLMALSAEVIAGAQILVRSLAAGTIPEVIPSNASAAVFTAAATRLTHERRYTALVPLQLSRMLDAAEGNDDAAHQTRRMLQRFDAVLVGGQQLPEAVATRAAALGIRIVRTYGSTETAGGCVYDGVPIGDTRLRLEAGELWVSSSQLAAGYLDQPEATRERFMTRDGARWFVTHDAAEIQDGQLRILGRIDNVFVSGGVNVSLDAIERVVHAQPGWEDAVAIAVPDNTWGQRCVLVSPREVADFADVQAAIRAEIGVAAVPLWHRALPDIPVLSSGKPDRRALAAVLS